MNFQTKVDIEPLGLEIDYRKRGFAVGSCFAENVAAALRREYFDIESNPFGIMFNPASVATCLGRLLNPKPYTEQDLQSDGKLWYSFAHHGSLSDTTPEACLDKLNGAQNAGAQALATADYVVVTLGTAWVFEHDGKVVANCHKRPAREFTRRRLQTTEIEMMLSELFSGALKDKHIILTVSPVRHIKDGLSENSLSKATLIVACHNLAAALKNVHYFPSYEIVTDELRDYRFYERDMLHPSPLAVEIVIDRFCEATMSARTIAQRREFSKLADTLAHRPSDPNSEAHKALITKTMSSIEALKAKIQSE